MEMSLEYACRTDCGLVRKINQDSYGVISLPHLELYVFLVADGMGGHRSGDVASQIAVSFLKDKLYKLLEKDLAQLELEAKLAELLIECNKYVYQESQSNLDYEGMGTTVTLLLIWKRTLYLAHVGDSRAYLLSNAHFQQLSTDQTVIQELLNHGSISPEEAQNHPKRHFLTQVIGMDTDVKPYLLSLDLGLSYKIILCSDGLHGYVEEEKILACIKENEKAQDLVDQLVDLALEAGAPDNVTVIALLSK